MLVVVIIIFIVSSNNNKAATSKLDLKTEYDLGYKEATSALKAQYDKDLIIIQGKDPILYTSPPQLGSFEVSIPRTWSWLINPNIDSGTFTGKADPFYILEVATTHAFTLDLAVINYQAKITEMDLQAKNSQGKITGSDVTVSGIAGRRYKGLLVGNNNSEVIIIPLREKVITFGTDDADKYSDMLNIIATSAKLTP